MMLRQLLFTVFFIFSLLLNVFSVQAQTSVYPDKVELNNGSILKCKILEYNLGGRIKLEIMGGSVLVYPASDVKKIDRVEVEMPTERNADDYHIFEKGMYYNLGLDILGGLKDDFWGGTVPTLGLDLNFSMGKVVNRHLMVGGGVAWVFMDNSIMFSQHLPVYAQVRGDLLKRNYSFYYTASIGYNWALRRQGTDWNGTQMTAASGGIYFNPGLGLRFASRSESHFCVEMGYSIHTASYHYLDATGGTAITRNTFIRPKLGCSILF